MLKFEGCLAVILINAPYGISLFVTLLIPKFSAVGLSSALTDPLLIVAPFLIMFTV